MMSSQHNDADDVVLTGLSGRLPESDSIEEFAQQLFAGVDLVTADDRRWTPGLYGLPERSAKLKDLAHFDSTFFGVLGKQANVMDPQLRMLLEVTHETIVDAGYNPTELRGSRTGVYVGHCDAESRHMRYKSANDVHGYILVGGCNSMFPGRISYTFDLTGPSLSIDTACSSSMHGIALATNAIRAGHCDAAIVAGTNLCMNPFIALSFNSLSMLSPNGRCATFDASGDGYVRAEATVAVLLQRRRDARRVYCTVRGVGVNNDGWKTKGVSYPNGAMQHNLAQETFEKAHLLPQDVTYVEAHGTGTKAGDPEEVNAIAELFCKNRELPLLVGSVKSNMGHSEPASGLCSIAKVVLAMERGVIPGNLHYTEPNPDIPALTDGRIKVVDTNTPWAGGLVAVNSFGFGGANAHIVLESHDQERPPPAEYSAPRLVLASGRTDEAVERLLGLAVEHPRDAELHALLDAVHARAISGHPRRGYAVLDPACGAQPVTEVLECEDEPRPVWFVFSGMGSQWPGMARTLMRLPVFAASIARSAAALEPHGVDLVNVITEATGTAFDNIINSFVSIAAIQVAMVDVLRELGVRPDGIIGHSVGEIGCAYADDTLTAEQTVLCAYWRGRCTLDARPPPGAMAAVGLTWEEATRRCPKDVELACHNTSDSVTISGQLSSVEKFLEQLSADGIFVRLVNTSRIAFHSKYIANVAPLLHERLVQVIPKPKQRSARWLSSSVPQDQWDSEQAKLSDAGYHVNNLVSPVRFAGLLPLVPERALVVEVAPHALLQAVLRPALPLACYVPLVRRDASDALTHFLSAVGKIYANGVQPQVSRLYPPVTFPVSRGTPALASHIGWDHSVEWSVVDLKTPEHTGENIIEYDLRKPEDAFLAGHNIDGRVIFPATGYMVLVWRTVAKMNNLALDDVAIVLENVEFLRATFVSHDVPLRFLVTLLTGTGKFEVCEGGGVVATGTVRITKEPATERLPTSLFDSSDDTQEDLPPLNSEDIYKDLHVRGYYYKDDFCGIKSCNARLTSGLLNWGGNWIAFMDTVLQFGLIRSDKRDLRLPTRLLRAVIDPAAQRVAINSSIETEGAIPVKGNPSHNLFVAGGIEFWGVKASLAPRRTNVQAEPNLEKYEFLPFDGMNTAEIGRSKRHALTAVLQLALENCGAVKLKLSELTLQRSHDTLLLPHALQVFEAEPVVSVDATLVAGADAPQYAAAMEPLRVKVSNLAKGGLEPDCHVVLGADVLARCDSSLLAELAAATAANGFVVLEEPAHMLDDHEAQALLTATGLTLVSRAYAASRSYLLLRRERSIPSERVVVEVRDDDYSWLEPLQAALRRAESSDMRVYVWSRARGSGVLGLGTCVRREAGGPRLRVYYLPGAAHEFEPDAPAYREQVQRDLAFNVLRAGVWGTYRHLPLDDVVLAQRPVEHAYVNTLTRGDLSSLRWVASELRLAAAAPRTPDTDLCQVYYAPLNFRDIMLATGKLPPDALPADLAGKECILGMEFSGRSSTGKRVMGMIPAKGLATTVLVEDRFVWEVPEKWSLEEAATVPIAYATAYYALAVRGRMRRGESVLVHAGTGGVGLAAIAVALQAGCTVFATAGTPEKRAFLREHFPQLPEANIGNSRDCSFEQLVLTLTRGRGVDLVLNSLAGDKLQASLRCLAARGRFLEIGKLDLSANSALGMAVLLRNTTVHGVLLDDLMEAVCGHPDKEAIVRCMTEGIANGAIRPLPTTVYGDDQLEQAFRYMATGKHIGKVLIRLREEEVGGKPAPTRLVPAIPCTYMHPAKSYVLVGGLGGFGLELGEWLTDRGARTLVFNSRSGVRTGYQAWCIRRWREKGIRVLLSTVDVTTEAGARSLLKQAATISPVGGIFNLAVVLRDALLENQTSDSFHAVAKPKTHATRALDEASRLLAPQLEHFVVFSSVSCGRGNAGQSNYGLANSGMERLCEQRQEDRLPGLAVQWGAVGDVGLVATMLGRDADAEVGATVPQRIASCLRTLDVLMTMPHAVVSSLVRADKRRAQDKPSLNVVQNVANILGIKDPTKVSSTATLAELGMDSLMGTEIKQTLERNYALPLSIQDVRGLTFGKLRDMGNDATATGTVTPAAVPANNALVQFTSLDELVPKQELIKLFSLPPSKPDTKPIFMVAPIEGVVSMLAGVAAQVRGAVYGLQCTEATPLDDMAALARFNVERVRSAKPHPPYTLLGYSYGAAVAFEMARQLESQGCHTRVVLVDGSPAFISSYTTHGKNKCSTQTQSQYECDSLAYFVQVYHDVNAIKAAKLANELERLPDWESRLTHVTEIFAKNGAQVDKSALRTAAHNFCRKLMIADIYVPSGRLQGPVTLFTASDGHVSLGADYGLREVCAGKLRTRQLTGTHRSILEGDAAQTIADHVSELLSL